MKTKADSYDIIGEAVRKWWDKHYECDVAVFFEQKYDFEDGSCWWQEEVIVQHDGSGGMVFDWDFCEGQTDVRNIWIAPLNDVLKLFRARVVKQRLKEAENELSGRNNQAGK